MWERKEYFSKTTKSIRSAINRHLSDIGRDLDIVHDKAFKQVKGALGRNFKQNMFIGLSKPTQHKSLVLPNDLYKISQQHLSSNSCPVI